MKEIYRNAFKGGCGAVLLAMSPAMARGELDWVRVSGDGSHFVRGEAEERFVVWGVNYDHDAEGALIEDYWATDWERVEEDFGEMKDLGVNVVRVHLQLGKFMETAKRANEAELGRLSKLVALAGEKEMYLNLTGLGCYHEKDVPKWYDALEEADRWAVQARVWEAIADRCAKSPAIFCYDLMNEPVLPGGEGETEWLTGELGGKHFVQRISLDLKGRSREEVARAWVERLTAAIRRHDARHLVTVGVIPWVHVFPKARPLFHGKEVGAPLDFVSVHFYPEKGGVEKALTALAAYELGKPLVVEEMFPLKCGKEELDDFIVRSAATVDGWFSFYWGRTIKEYQGPKPTLAEAITADWLEQFQKRGAALREEP